MKNHAKFNVTYIGLSDFSETHVCDIELGTILSIAFKNDFISLFCSGLVEIALAQWIGRLP